MRRFSILALTALTALILSPFAAADDPAAKEPTKEPAKQQTQEKAKAERETKDDEDEVLTFSTEDLERKYGPSSKPVVKKTEVPAGTKRGAETLSPLEQLQANQKANQDRAVQRKDAAKRVQAAQTRLKELEQRVARLRNPLLGRVEPEADEKGAWSAADQAGRVKIAEDAVLAARVELQQAVQAQHELR